MAGVQGHMVTKALDVAHDIAEDLWTDQWGITPIVERWFSGPDVGASRTVVLNESVHFRYVSAVFLLCREAMNES
jgi:hypothetical protein